MRHFVTFFFNNFLAFTPEIENIPDIPCPGMNVYKSNKIADWGSSEEKTRLSPTATLETNNIVSQRVLFRTLMIIGVVGIITMLKQNSI